jgi:hypothetical protein
MAQKLDECIVVGKKISIGVIIGLILQFGMTIGSIAWIGGKLDSRVTQLEKWQADSQDEIAQVRLNTKWVEQNATLIKELPAIQANLNNIKESVQETKRLLEECRKGFKKSSLNGFDVFAEPLEVHNAERYIR